MSTITSRTSRILAALGLSVVLACGSAMANDSYQDAMENAIAHNDSRLLDNAGGATIIDRPTGNGDALAPGLFHNTMRGAVARNDSRYLVDIGGATIVDRSDVVPLDETLFAQTMRQAFRDNDSRLLPDNN